MDLHGGSVKLLAKLHNLLDRPSDFMPGTTDLALPPSQSPHFQQVRPSTLWVLQPGGPLTLILHCPPPPSFRHSHISLVVIPLLPPSPLFLSSTSVTPVSLSHLPHPCFSLRLLQPGDPRDDRGQSIRHGAVQSQQPAGEPTSFSQRAFLSDQTLTRVTPHVHCTILLSPQVHCI